MAATEYYPPYGFYYTVDAGLERRNRGDSRFQSLAGLSVEYEYESFREGGENRFEHKLPVRTRYSDLVLKRGMLVGSPLIDWTMAAFRDREFTPLDLTISLLNEQGEPLRTWKVAHAVPKKWSVSDLDSTNNAIVIETLECAYRYFTMG